MLPCRNDCPGGFHGILDAITTNPANPVNAGLRGAATTLRSILEQCNGVLSKGEKMLLDELPVRLADARA